MSDGQFDAIVIGGGHNGLVTANYLAMGGLKVCVLEQRHIVGGAAVSEEFHPGYRNSVASYVVSLLRPEVIDDLELKKHGYQTLPLDNSFYVDSSGDYLLLTEDDNNNRKEFEKFSATDYQSYKQFYEIIDKAGDVVTNQWLREPPKLAESGLGDFVGAVKLQSTARIARDQNFVVRWIGSQLLSRDRTLHRVESLVSDTDHLPSAAGIGGSPAF